MQLGADAVRTGDQHRPEVAIHRQLEEPAEAADAGEHARAPGALRQGLDAFNQAIAAFDIDAGVAVGDGFWPRVGHRGMVRTPVGRRKP